MLHSALRRLQIRASQASEKELRRAALWSAALVLGVPAISWLTTTVIVPNPALDAPRWLDLFIFVISLPLAPGFLLGGWISMIFWAHGGRFAPASIWIGAVLGLIINWYLYFVLFAIWISRRNRAKLQRAAARGTSPNVA
jgi:hypothetical protein